jgi:hypothetical protein
MKMKESIPSLSAGSLTTILLTINGMGIIETIVLAFLGGVAGYLGKIAIEWTIKKIKKLL